MAQPPKAGPAFNKAANAEKAWREPQKAALDERARAVFARIREETERKKRETAKRLEWERERMVEQEKAKLMLQRPGLALRLLPSRTMRESIAYFKAADLVRRAEHHILETIEHECRQREDAFLKEQEHERAERQRREQSRTLSRDFQQGADRGGDERWR